MQQKTYEAYNQECRFWSTKDNRFLKTQIQIIIFKQKEVKYIQDGQILRIDQFTDVITKPDILENIEQIKFLKWQGRYGQCFKKVDKWNVIWNGQKFSKIGGYYSDKGEKQGLWMDLIKNFQNNAKAYEFGEYINNKRVGTWKQFYQDKQLGVGNYNEQGQRDGKWTQLSDYFFNQKQVIYEGEYKNGKKVGLWNIYYENLFIGGGLYEYKKRGESLEQTKIGKWIELSEGFYDWSQVTYEGQYKNGKRFGRWNIWFKKNYGDKNIELMQLNLRYLLQRGGGLYDCEQQNDGLGALKIGKWIELSEGFNCNNQITYSGVYKKGFKVGRWNTFDQKNYIGGGVYEQKLEYDGMCTNKVGRWMELSDGFSWQFWVKSFIMVFIKMVKKLVDGILLLHMMGGLIKCMFEYYLFYKKAEVDFMMNKMQAMLHKFQLKQEGGLKKVIVLIYGVKLFMMVNMQMEKKLENGISCLGNMEIIRNLNRCEGYYSEKQECDGLLGSIKIGRWVELFERFGSGNLLQQIVYNGEYKNGFKIGRWNTLYRGDTEIKFQQIGGGSYIDKQGSTKNGQWKELSDNFQNDFEQSQIIENGHYKNGKKIGKWEVMDFSRKNKIIDYKYYDDSKNTID
ncbi:unnamed protein product [Paramecium primaurelia]|uniref:Uncharacterized protein n=1 Tax=Paramecium primaurelia TaxID=5886 RepID=A0A8S1P166_PARPR|nr:unnamed protein product [Paramecium primaurelia]